MQDERSMIYFQGATTSVCIIESSCMTILPCVGNYPTHVGNCRYSYVRVCTVVCKYVRPMRLYTYTAT